MATLSDLPTVTLTPEGTLCRCGKPLNHPRQCAGPRSRSGRVDPANPACCPCGGPAWHRGQCRKPPRVCNQCHERPAVKKSERCSMCRAAVQRSDHRPAPDPEIKRLALRYEAALAEPGPESPYRRALRLDLAARLRAEPQLVDGLTYRFGVNRFGELYKFRPPTPATHSAGRKSQVGRAS